MQDKTEPEAIEHNGRTVEEIIEDDKPDLSDADLRDAYLWDADLTDADLTDADLSDADLFGANLTDANLSDANLTDANLRYAYLTNANLTDANLTDAYLRDANLRNTNLRDADLRDANLRDANLRYAYLRGAKIDKNSIERRQCVSQSGSFIAYKATENNIVKIEIPSDADRHTAIKSRKCRAEFVDVIEVLDGNGNPCPKTSATGSWNNGTEYVEGERVHPDKYDDDPRIECSHGIHFFVTKQEAIDWL